MKVIITAFRGEARNLLRYLKDKGKFKMTSFRDVLIGEVEDIDKFLSKIVEDAPLSLSRVMPLERSFEFSSKEELFDKIIKYIPKELENFRVSVERRGWKGEINKQELERFVGSKIKGNVKLVNPENELVIEILDNLCGVFLITKEIREKYYFIKCK